MDRTDGVEARRGRAAWLGSAVEELVEAIHRDRWGLALMLVGWVHLAAFLACEALFVSGDRRSLPYLALWGLELVAVVFLMRRAVTARGRRPAPEITGLIARVWVTFLILKFNAVSLNTLMGMETMNQEWFKPMWGTLSTFGFAMMAWLTTPWFLVLAVQMSATAALIAKVPAHAYLIYGISWFAAFQAMGLALEWKRATLRATNSGPSTAPSPYSAGIDGI